MTIELSLGALWVVSIAQGALLLALYRQFGLALLRNAKAISEDGLPTGAILPRRLRQRLTPWPPTHGSDDGRRIIVFARTTCQACAAVWPALEQLARERANLDIVVILAGDIAAVEQYRRTHALRFAVLPDPDEEWFGLCGVRVSPFAIGVASGDFVVRSGLANNLAHLRFAIGDEPTPSTQPSGDLRTEGGLVHGTELAR